MNDKYLPSDAYIGNEPEDYDEYQQDFYEWNVINESASLVASKGYQYFLSKLTEAIAARSGGVL
jgi:hypothetical protein